MKNISIQKPLIFIFCIIVGFVAVLALYSNKQEQPAHDSKAYVIDGVRSGDQKIEISIVKPEE
jgi:hypothetical protein